mmetsp:Transcript_17791/g.17974  ORF Transcript_17791/g.17974 Transcript_17791/m.17974 type:complete len:176 (-) Transcript_17791:139-666(-)
MVPGFNQESAKDRALRHKISMSSSRDTDEDFRKLLGDEDIVGPNTVAEGLVMLKGIDKILNQLADGDCIASSGYTLAAELWERNKRHIDRINRQDEEPHFLIRLLCRIDRENRALLEDLFEEVKQISSHEFQWCPRNLNSRDERIHKLFDGLRFDDTSQMNLPQHFSSLLRAKQR